MRFTRSYLIIPASRAFANARGRNASRPFCRECVAARIATGEVVHLDATLIRANVSWDAVVEAHADAVFELDSTSAPSPEVATTRKTQRICQTDPDASLGKGGRLPRVEPAYKQQTAVDTKQGVILDVEVTTGRVHDSN